MSASLIWAAVATVQIGNHRLSWRTVFRIRPRMALPRPGVKPLIGSSKDAHMASARLVAIDVWRNVERPATIATAPMKHSQRNPRTSKLCSDCVIGQCSKPRPVAAG